MDARLKIVPASLRQEQMWFLERLAPGRSPYTIPFVYRMRGQFDVAVFERSLAVVVRRHEALRTTIRERDGELVQVVAAELDLPVLVTDLSAGPAGGLAIDAAIGECLHTPFDLEAGPLLRARVLRLAPDDHYVMITVHHLIFDGWSMSVFFDELRQAYGALASGAAPCLPEVGTQYADFAAWERGFVASRAYAGQLAYWQDRLAGMPPLLDLRGDRPRPAVGDMDCGTEFTTFPQRTADAVAELTRCLGATPFVVMLAALAVVLQRYSGQDDICIGTPMAARTRREFESTIGLFVNALPLRVDLSGGPSARELCGRVRETVLGAMMNQDVPVGRIVAAVSSGRSAAYMPLFQVLLVQQTGLAGADGTPLDLPGVTAQSVPVGFTDSDFDLQLTIGAAAHGGIEATLQYSRAMFDGATAAALLGHLVTVIECFAADPDVPVGRLDLLGQADRDLMVRDWNDTAADVPAMSLPGLFEERVAAVPESVAVTCGGRALTFLELNERANQLAFELIARGLGAEDLVAVLMPRSLESVVALLAIFKAGAAYLPIDLTMPPRRIAGILAGAAPALVITTSGAAPAGHPGAVLALDEGAAAAIIAGRPRHNVSDAERVVPLRPRHIAYVIYTSGSTGEPKGVIIECQNLVNLSHHFRRTTLARHASATGRAVIRVATTSPLSFDACWLAILGMFAGHEMHLLDDRTRLDPDALVGYLHEHDIDLLDSSPGYVAELMDYGLLRPDPETGRVAIRTLNLGGEAVPDGLWRLVRESPQTAGLNTYGPTENTVDALVASFDAAEVPVLGRPTTNVLAYILDSELQPVPLGAVGELYLAGEQVARGYLRLPGLTAARFLPCPFLPGGRRMYRTGDLARWRRDGNVEYLGRADDQVQIHGFRVELAEVEAALERCPGVAAATAVVREDRPGIRRLCGYVVAGAAAEVDPAAVRDHVAGLLPGYMVPAAIVVLGALPLTANGKVDRRALPPPDLTPAASRAPRTAREEILCGLFAEVLGVSRVGIDDDFFQLGGDSLLAIRLLGRIRSALGEQADLRALFLSATVAGLVRELGADGAPARRALARGERPARIPLSFAQRRLLFLARFEGPSATYNLPLVLRLAGPLDRGALQDAIGDVTGRHESLRTIFPETDGEPFQRIIPPGEAVPRVAWRGASAVGMAERIALACGHVFDLASELPVRAEVLTAGPDEHVLVLLMHHIASDGWSLGPLARDLATAYAARLEGRAPDWGELPVQYADYALWQQELLGAGADPASPMAVESAFWRQALAGLPDEIALPADRPRPAVASHAGETVGFTVGADVHAALLALARQAGVTPFMVAHAALAVLLTRLGAGTDLPIGIPVAGRAEPVLDDLIGFFVNTVVLRADTSGDPTFRELLARIRETDLAALRHQDLPFERVVELLNPARSPSRHPLFQVMLNFESAVGGSFALPGLTVEELGGGTGSAKFDLSFGLTEQFSRDGRPAGLDGALEFAADLFDEETAIALTRRLVRVLTAAAAEPDRPIGAIDVLEPAERELLRRVNDTTRPVEETTVAALLERQAASTPEATAVIAGAERLSYRELSERAELLARQLAAAGAGPERTVAVRLPRSADLIVALCAVLRAGAAYLPIDPETPPAREAAMVAAAGPALLLTPGVLAGLAAAPEPPAVPRPPHPDGAAYVMFTSGSTGRPKGVVVSHRALVNRLAWLADQFGYGADERVLVKSPIGFDVSVPEILGSLTSGGTLVVAPEGMQRDPAALAALIAAERVTQVHFVPSMLAWFVATPGAAACPSLRRVFCGGEAFSGPLLTACLETFRAPVYNLYGPTETTVEVTIFAAGQAAGQAAGSEAGSEAGGAAGSAAGRAAGEAAGGAAGSAAGRAAGGIGPTSVPLGGPVWNTRCHVLDDSLRPVPVGVTGELLVGGAQLARGYVGAGGLTAERFVPDPFCGGGGRLYRTGDLVRWTADGSLVFVGRRDGQVKLRGHRVELAEVESVLVGMDDVAAAGVVLREDRPGDARLAAYVVPAAGTDPDPASIRTRAAGLLPPAMVPSAVAVVGELPLTASGKLDRRALAGWPAAEPAHGAGAAPRTGHERLLRDLWAEVLCDDSVGIHDDFFGLGGHSLTALSLAYRIERATGVPVEVLEVFRRPTVAAMAELIAGAAAAPRSPVSVVREGAGQPLILVHAISGELSCYVGLAGRLGGHGALGLTAPGVGAGEQPIGSVSGLASHHIAALDSYGYRGGYRLAGWSFGGVLAQEMAVQLEERGDRVDLVLMFDSRSPWPEIERPVTDDEALRALLGDGLLDLDEATVRRLTAMARAHLGADAGYRPARRYGGRLVVIRAADDPDEIRGPALGWERWSDGELVVRTAPGDHFTMLREPQVSWLAAIVAAELDIATRRPAATVAW